MILEAAAAIGVLGLILFVAGFATDRPELAMFGALFVIGVGAGGMIDGYQVQTGEVRTTVNNSSTNESVTTINATYEDIEVHPDFPLDIVIILLGAVMLIGSSGAASEADLRDEEQKKPPWERGR